MIDEVIQVVTKLLEFSDRFQQANADKRQKIQVYYLNIATCFEKSAEKLKSNPEQVPNTEWQELSVYAEKLPKILGEYIGTTEAVNLSNQLINILNNIPTSNDIESIERATGQFRGLANTANFMPNQPESEPSRINFMPRFSTSSRRSFFIFPVGALVGFSAAVFNEKSQLIPNVKPSNFFKPSITWKMETFLGESTKKTLLYNAPKMVCDLVNRMTDGDFVIKLDRNGNTEEILQRVSRGKKNEDDQNGTDCGYSGIYYNDEKYRPLFFSSAIPFGLNAQEQNTWLSYQKETDSNNDNSLTFIQEVYKKIFQMLLLSPREEQGRKWEYGLIKKLILFQIFMI